MTRLFLLLLISEEAIVMITCEICSKTFNRRDNMYRHMKSVHSKPEDETQSGISDTDSSLMEEESESESRSSIPDCEAWDSIITLAYDKLQPKFEEAVQAQMKKNGLNLDDAKNKVFEDMKSDFRKAVMNNFMARMEWFCAIQQDPVYKAIKQTAANLRDLDYFDRSEAWKYATSKRKYLFDKIISEYDPPGLEEDEDDDSSDTEISESLTD